MFDEDTMPDWMRTMRGVAPNAASAAGAPAAVTPAAAASVAAPSTAPQFIPVPEGMPPDANQVIYSATYTVYHPLKGRGFVCFGYDPASVHCPKPKHMKPLPPSL